MKLSKRTNAIILWLISIGLLVSMVIAFTPTLGSFFGGGAATAGGQPELVVNGQTIRELRVAQARQNPPYNIPLEGEAGGDIELLLTESLISQSLVEQAAANVRVSNAEVNEAVREFRTSQGVAGSGNDQRYLALIGQFGFTDATFREYYRQQLRIERYQENITANVTVSEAEVQAFYEANQDAYRSEDRIRARQIVVDDEATAQEALARARAGEDFAALAQEVSLERADRAGALGAAAGSTETVPVGRAALPTAVATAAFGLGGPGLTDVVEANGRYYLIAVEEYVPSGVRPLEEVREQVEADALAAKQQGELERAYEALRAQATVEVPATSTLTLDDPVVARVGSEAIHRSDLARALYLNPQIQQSLDPSTADLITALFKPSILEQLIELELAYQGAASLDANFIGSKAQVAQQALAYVSRDAVATDEDLQAYYADNQAQFTVPASAVATRVDFADAAQAAAFREALLAGEAVDAAATANEGTIQDLGTVAPGTLPSEFDTALFQTDGFDELPDGREVSDVLVTEEALEAEPPTPEAESADGETIATEDTGAEEPAPAAAETSPDAPDVVSETDPEDAAAEADETAETEAAEATDPAAQAELASDTPVDDTLATDTPATDTPTEAALTREVYVVLVAERTPEQVRAFEEVRGQIEQIVLQSRRAELQDAWLSGLRETIAVENLLSAATLPETPGFTFDTEPLDPAALPDAEADPDTEADPAAAPEGDAVTEPATQETVDAPATPQDAVPQDGEPTETPATPDEDADQDTAEEQPAGN